MRDEDLTSLLSRAPTSLRRRTESCPDENQIAAYVDGTLEPADAERLELHLADCDACIALVGLLGRAPDTSASEPVADLALERARRLAPTARTRWMQTAPRWAAAAMVVVTVSALIHFSQSPDSGLESPTSPEGRATRTIAPGSLKLQVVDPGPGTTMEAGHLLFRWTEVPGSRFYDVRIVTDSGELVSERRVVGTEWRPSGDLELRPGAEYYVHVDAYPTDAKAISSDHVPFSVTE
jgi:Putative zinc-finger